MKIEDISRARLAVSPDCIVMQSPVEICRKPSEDTPPGGGQVEEYLHLLTPQPLWPRVFPGL